MSLNRVIAAALVSASLMPFAALAQSAPAATTTTAAPVAAPAAASAQAEKHMDKKQVEKKHEAKVTKGAEISAEKAAAPADKK